MINGGYVLNGWTAIPVRQRWKSLITIKERIKAMARPAIHPGEVLAGELEEIGVSPTGLARQIDVPPNRISQIINGKRAITGDTALRLGHWFGTSPTFWLNLQVSYDLRLAEQAAGNKISGLPTRSVSETAQRIPA
jgi:antitoxin HigA-1